MKYCRVRCSKWHSNHTDELFHHGIKGQRWGVRHGPPYPLKASQKGGYQGIRSRLRGASKTSNDSRPALKATGPRLRDQFERVNESQEQSLKKANPIRKTKEGRENCSSCVIAGHMRRLGYDATAKAVHSPFPPTLDSMLTDSFPGVKVKSKNAKEFGASPDKAADVLRKQFGDNASGIVGYTNRDGEGHVFNWSIKNGTVSFADYQQGWNDQTTRRQLWSKYITTQGSVEFANLEGIDFNDSAVASKVNIKKR